MKRLVLLILAYCLSFSFAAAQCNDYYAIEKESEWTYDHFDNKGKPAGKNTQKVKEFQKTPGGFKAVIYSVFLNEKGKKVMEGDLEMSCDNGTIIIDMRKFVPEEQQKAFGNYEMKIESENLETPNKLTVGQTLKNGSITMTAVGSPIPMKISVVITDRKVEAKETITTPAGTFECFKISSKSTSKTQMGMNMTFEMTTREWLAPKVGMVKSESFDKNGKSAGYTVLSAKK